MGRETAPKDKQVLEFNGFKIKHILPLTEIENVQLAISPAESVAMYAMCLLPTSNFCGGSKPLRLTGSLELSVGFGTCHVALANGCPGSVGISTSRGH